MNVASLELCKELYELSWWMDTGIRSKYEVHNGGKSQLWSTYSWFNDATDYPAYDLGYLLRKLPRGAFLFNNGDDISHLFDDGVKRQWVFTTGQAGIEAVTGDTPENVVCKLAIELFKQGILTKEPEND